MDLKEIEKLLKKKAIMYKKSYDESEISIGRYPKYIIVYIADIDYTLPDYPHTGLFYWIVSWNDWKKSSTPKRNQAYTPAEAIKIIKQAMQELGISKNTIQETLFFLKGEEMKKVINQVITEHYALYNGDSCEVMQGLPDESMGYSIFSPPFEDLYTYSDSPRDLGNCRSTEEFYKQFGYIVAELFRITKPGRLVSIHCMDLPTTKASDGFIGLRDFPGILRELFQDYGFYYHSKITIWKDPVVAMQRTKHIGLLHKQLKKDSAMSRQGIADYIVTMRKPGENKEPITHTNESFPVSKWQEYASPVWMNIRQSNTLNRTSAREERDEKHICPLQLDVIERCIELWTNQGDTVFTPFLGIGSEAYQSIKMHRKAVGIELKESYFEQAVKNCERAANAEEQLEFLFEGDEE